MVGRITFAGAITLAGLSVFAQTRPAPSFEADYQTVLHIMKSPPATGVMVADVNRDGAADKGGITPGDIITNYGGTPIETLGGLKQSMADALAAMPDAGPKVELKVFRAGKPLSLTVDRGGLEVTPVEVRVGVACALNPPPTAKADLHLAWDELLPPGKTDGHDAAVQPARREYLVLRAGDGVITGFMQRTLSRDGAALESDMKVFTREDPEEATLHITTRFAPSDGIDLPPFLLDTLTYDNPLVHLKVQRQGTRLVERGRKDDTSPDVTPTLLGAVPLECGVEAVAGAMPQQEGRVLGYSGLDPYSLQTRPGYVLVTLGRRKVTINKQDHQLWGVQEMRFGQVERTWWFDDQRRVNLIEAPDLRVERVGTEDAAKAMMKEGGK